MQKNLALLRLNTYVSCAHPQNYFAAMAITIQRHWRGFWSRKYVFNFHARKKYLAHVASVNAQVRQ